MQPARLARRRAPAARERALRASCVASRTRVQGGKRPALEHPQARLQQLLTQLKARVDAMPEVAMPGYVLRIYDRRLFLVTGERPQAGPQLRAVRAGSE